MPPQDNPQGDYTFYDNKGNVYSVKGLRVSTGGAAHPATEEEAKRHLASNGIIDIFSAREKVDKLAPQVRGNDAVGGFARRGASTFGAMLPAEDIGNPAEMLANSSLNPINILINQALAEKKLGPQTKAQFKARDPRAIVSALSMLNPFATQSVADINEMRDEGRDAEARGAGLFDALMLGTSSKIAERKIGNTIAELRNPIRNFKLRSEFPKGVNVDRLAHATGAELYKHAEELRDTAPHLEAEASKSGRPKSIQQLRELMTSVKQKADTRFNSLLFPHRNQQIIPMRVVNELKNLENSKALREEAAAGDPEARADLRYIQQQIIKWSRPFSLEALNEMRSRESAQGRALKEKTIERQGAKIRGSMDTKVEQAIETGLKDTVYGFLEQKYPKENIRGLKKLQSQLMTLESDVTDRVKSVEAAQMSQRGRLAREKLTPSAYGRPQSGTVGVHVHGLQRLLPDKFGGPEAVANAATRKAFPSQSRAAKLGRAAKRGAGLAAPLAPKDRRKALEAQLAIAEKVDKRWAARLRKKLEEEQ